MKKAIVLLVTLLSFTLTAGNLTSTTYKEGFKVKLSKKSWTVKRFPKSKFGISMMATPRRKSSVKYFSVTIKPLTTEQNIGKICHANTGFLRKISKEKVSAKIKRSKGKKLCYINYINKGTEQYIFKTKKNYLVALTVENSSKRKRKASSILKYFSM